MFKYVKHILIVTFLSSLFIISCKKKESDEAVRTSKKCVYIILKQDDSLGTVRNHACKKISLSQTIKEYTSNLNQLDFSNCYDAFSDAFKKHIIAWNEMLKITDKHPKLRGEMHDLFDMIEKTEDSIEFKSLLKKIWNTWAIIEDAKNIE